MSRSGAGDGGPPKRRTSHGVAIVLAASGAVLWFTPFAWMIGASLQPPENFSEAWQSGHFPLWYLNTFLMCGGILAVQCVTVSCAGYAFARLEFPGRDLLFSVFLLQLMLVPTVLIVPNLTTLVQLHLYDTLAGIMAPYFASAFGVFLMRQTFRTLPRDFEEAAEIDGATRLQILRLVLLPMARPGLAAFAIVSVTAHWNEFLWPLMATSSPSTQVLTTGLASFTSGAESGNEWGLIAAGTCLVAGPLLLLFLLFQKHFVSSFVFSGLK